MMSLSISITARFKSRFSNLLSLLDSATQCPLVNVDLGNMLIPDSKPI